MAKVKLAWTRQAIADLDNAYAYIATANPDAATAIIEKIEWAAQTLTSYPQIGRKGRVDGTRELVVTGTPFVVPYRVGHDRVEIVAIIHAARRWPVRFR